MRLLFITISFLICLSAPTVTFSVVEENLTFDDPKTERRYKKLITELRCLVCQNQSLAGSNAELAKDLRKKTVDMIKAGATNKEVRTYMTDRYGDFILYRPPFNMTTAFLWLGPFLLLLLVIIGIVINVRKRQQDELFAHSSRNDEQTTVKVRNLLRDTPKLSGSNSQSNIKADK